MEHFFLSLGLALKAGLIKLFTAGLVALGVTGMLSGDSTKTAGLLTYYLSGSGVTSSATSITLTSLTLPQNGYEIQDSDLSDTFYLTLEPGNRTKQEFVSCTTLSQSGSDTTATLSGCIRGLSPVTPYTASTTLQFAHGGGTSIVFSNPPQLYNDITFKNNDETIANTWTFSSTSRPRLDVDVTTAVSAEFVTYGQLNAVTIGQVGTSTELVLGLVRLTDDSLLGTGQASSSSGAPLVLKNSKASSTYDGSKSNIVVVTGSNNTIDNDFISTTSPYIWSGLNRFTAPLNASSTLSVATKLNVASSTPSQEVNLTVMGGALISGTTTLSTLTVASSTLSWNRLTYQGATSQSTNGGMATTSALINDGSGGLSWGIPVSVGATTTNIKNVNLMVIPHGLGRIPRLIEIYVQAEVDNAGTEEFSESWGYATSTRDTEEYYSGKLIRAAASIVYTTWSGAANIIDLRNSGGAAQLVGDLTDINATTFTINLSTNADAGGTRRFLWKVQ